MDESGRLGGSVPFADVIEGNKDQGVSGKAYEVCFGKGNYQTNQK